MEISNTAITDCKWKWVVLDGDADDSVEKKRWQTFFLLVRISNWEYRNDYAWSHESCSIHNSFTHIRVGIDGGNNGGSLPESKY